MNGHLQCPKVSVLGEAVEGLTLFNLEGAR